MTAFDEHGRPEPPTAADEWETLTGYVDFLRSTIAWKTAGLSDDQLRAAPLPSAMTLGGMFKHLAFVEWYWCSCILQGDHEGSLWAEIDWDADPDWDWHSAASQTGDELRTLWQEAVADSRRRALAFVDTHSDPLSALATGERGGERVSLRWILVHLIEEYGRHCGHADLLREAIDGQTGE